jgi:hypothetical protein
MSPPVRLERKYIPANVRVTKTASNRADVSVTPIPRYKALGEARVVVFVVEDQDKSGRFLKAAGRIITGRIGTRGSPNPLGARTGAGDSPLSRSVMSTRDRFGPNGSREHPPALRKALLSGRGDTTPSEQVASLLPLAFLRH